MLRIQPCLIQGRRMVRIQPCSRNVREVVSQKEYLTQLHPHVCTHLDPPSAESLVSTKFPYHAMHPIIFALLLMAYAEQEQSLKHCCSHAFQLKFLSIRAHDVSGIFTCSNLTKPSPFLHASSFLTQPLDAFLMFHSSGNLGWNPGRHLHSKTRRLSESQ